MRYVLRPGKSVQPEERCQNRRVVFAAFSSLLEAFLKRLQIVFVKFSSSYHLSETPESLVVAVELGQDHRRVEVALCHVSPILCVPDIQRGWGEKIINFLWLGFGKEGPSFVSSVNYC